MNPRKLIILFQEVCLYVGILIFLLGIFYTSIFWEWSLSTFAIKDCIFAVLLWITTVLFFLMLAFYPSQFSKTNITRHARNQRSLLN